MSNPNGDTWNERLSYALEKRGMSQTALAKAVGVSNPTVTAWVTDQETLKANNKAKVDAALKLPSRYLLEGACTLEDTEVVGNSVDIRYNIEKSDIDEQARAISESLSPESVIDVLRELVDEMTPEQRLELVRIASSPTKT